LLESAPVIVVVLAVVVVIIIVASSLAVVVIVLASFWSRQGAGHAAKVERLPGCLLEHITKMVVNTLAQKLLEFI